LAGPAARRIPEHRGREDAVALDGVHAARDRNAHVVETCGEALARARRIETEARAARRSGGERALDEALRIDHVIPRAALERLARAREGTPLRRPEPAAPQA